MTDQNQEIEALRKHNAELLDEIKAVKGKLREQGEADTTTADKLAALSKELASIKTADTLHSSWSNAGVHPNFAKYAVQECRYELAVTDDGEIVAVDKETGERIIKNEQGEPLTADEVMTRAFAEMRDTHNHFFGQSIGSGAMGSASEFVGVSTRRSTPKPAVGLGFR